MVTRKSINSSNQALGHSLALQSGLNEDEWACLDTLWGVRESGWNSTVLNKGGSGAFGIAQFLDSTWKGTGYQKSPDPVIQIKAGLVYIKNRYQDSCNALKHSLALNWY